MNASLRFLGLIVLLGAGLLADPSPTWPRTPLRKPQATVQLPPLPEEKTTPWGKEVDGLSCRLTVPAKVTHGQPIRAVLEIRNNSKVTRYPCNQLDPLFREFCTLAVTGPGGKALQQNNSVGVNLSRDGYDPRSFPALAAGQTRRFELADIRGMFSSGVHKDGEWLPVDRFATDGTYTLRYTYRSPKCALKFPMGSRSVVKNGKPVIEPIYAEPTKEQLAGIFTGTLESAAVTVTVRPLNPDDLAVHEWGVFTVFSDLKHANVNRKQEWLSLPPDFYRQFPTRRLVWQPAAWNKPIIYFHTKQPSLEVEVKVGFGEGVPVVWWPAAASPLDNGLNDGGRMAGPQGPAPTKPFHKLRWSGWLGDVVPVSQSDWVKVKDFELPRHAWIEDARLAEVARFTVSGSHIQRSAPWITTRSETERFIYYDGLVPAPDYLRCTAVTAAAVTVKNTAKFPIANLFLVDRRGDRPTKDWAVACRTEPIPAGGERAIPLQAIRPAKDSEDLKKLAASVRQTLLATGLTPAETDSILKIWHADFFEADGLTAFWILPQAEYDRMLPLRVTPAPANRPTRVGIAHHPHFEVGPRVRERVGRLIEQLDSKTFALREAANRELEALGPWVVPQVREALTKKPSLETTRRLEAILQKADASEWLKQTAPEPKKPAR